ncbi:MAG: hypothetical protein F4180_00835, partial [Chloroflexi bacterium]|nr:hypothetical protein [Chloroflexota bacterium]
LGGNQLTGSIPSELGQLHNLAGLYLSGNQLTGSIPPELGQLQNLTGLHLSGNRLTGCIPLELREVPNNDFADLGLPFCDLNGTDEVSPLVGGTWKYSGNNFITPIEGNIQSLIESEDIDPFAAQLLTLSFELVLHVLSSCPVSYEADGTFMQDCTSLEDGAIVEGNWSVSGDRLMQSAGGTTTTLRYSVTGDTLDLIYTRQQLLSPDDGGADPDTQRLYDLVLSGIEEFRITFIRI